MMPKFVPNSSWNLISGLFSSKNRGRPRLHDPRNLFEAIMYLAKTGCQWRFLPSSYPPWKTVYWHFKNWINSGKLDIIMSRIRKFCRNISNKDYRSRIGMIDSQSVKTTNCAATNGFDGNKKNKGHKRHLLVDSLGLLISVVVTRANLHDIKGGRMLVQRIKRATDLDRIRLIYADSAYKSLNNEGIPVEITTNLSKGFSPLPQRWKVERSISWMQSYRRTTIDYERKCFHAEAWVKLAFIGVGMNRMKKN